MSDQPTPLQLAKLAEKFNSAVQNGFAENAQIAQQIKESVDMDEVAELQGLMQEFVQKAMALMTAQGPEAAEKKLAPEALILTEKSLNLITPIIGEKALEKFVEDSDRTTQNSEGFAANNAPTLARLYAPK